eukprot:1773067-Alexandrium_andersonii.AAC.1
MDMDAWAAAMGGSIRATLSMFKWLKRCPRQLATTFAKAISGFACVAWRLCAGSTGREEGH